MPERPGVANLADALDVRTQAVRGFGLAFLLSAGVLVFFAVVPARTTRPRPLYPLLAVVLFAGLGTILTLLFVLGAAYRLARSLD